MQHGRRPTRPHPLRWGHARGTRQPEAIDRCRCGRLRILTKKRTRRAQNELACRLQRRRGPKGFRRHKAGGDTSGVLREPAQEPLRKLAGGEYGSTRQLPVEFACKNRCAQRTGHPVMRSAEPKFGMLVRRGSVGVAGDRGCGCCVRTVGRLVCAQEFAERRPEVGRVAKGAQRCLCRGLRPRGEQHRERERSKRGL